MSSPVSEYTVRRACRERARLPRISASDVFPSIDCSSSSSEYVAPCASC